MFMKIQDDSIIKMRNQLQKELGIANVMAVPHLIKIVINCGIGEAILDKKIVEKVVAQIAAISGQRPVVRKAKKAIASFKVRENDPIGVKVTLRGKRMRDFLSRLVAVALPRVRDFRGIPKKGFDGNGNYTMGIAEQTMFPDLDYSLVDKVRGFEVTFVTTAKTDAEAQALLKMLGMPFEK